MKTLKCARWSFFWFTSFFKPKLKVELFLTINVWAKCI
jgi:hypothetical protein